MEAIRYEHNPIISPGTPGVDTDRLAKGPNINGPSLIRVPDWLPNPLGKYYLYFAHHNGTYIRLAYADRVTGPWTMHEPGTLQLAQTACDGHVASPDIHILEDARQLRMYFHGPAQARKGQWSYIAHSTDGLHFTPGHEIVAPFYMRVFAHDGWHYALAKDTNIGTVLARSRDGLSTFEEGPNILPMSRHTALLRRGDTMHVFFSRAEDDPESIMVADIDLTRPWTEWAPHNERLVLKPERDYEGADLPLKASSWGPVFGRAHQLRDPGIFEDDGRTWLLYSIAGEMGLALAELKGI